MEDDSRSCRRTIAACHLGFVSHAIVINLLPLLLLIFRSNYSLSLGQVTFLVSLNFAVQLCVDFTSIFFVDKLGYQKSIVCGQFLAAFGIAGLGFLPELLADPFAGLSVSIICFAIGGGLNEVLISPILESCPTERKDAEMSLLHSYFSFGHVGVILFTTGFLFLFGRQHWRFIPLILSIIPFCSALFFMRVPFYPLIREGKGMNVREMAGTRVFWIFIVMMICAAGCEQAMNQWSSAYAEAALKISKNLGDLCGPCLFALLTAVSRLLYEKLSSRIELRHFMLLSGILCAFSYLLAAFPVHPAFGLAGVALCGLAIGILWPGTVSLAAENCPRGGTTLFALLALAGDVGCSGGPGLVGNVADWAGGNLKAGMAAAIIFPVLLIIMLCSSGKEAEDHS